MYYLQFFKYNMSLLYYQIELIRFLFRDATKEPICAISMSNRFIPFSKLVTWLVNHQNCQSRSPEGYKRPYTDAKSEISQRCTSTFQWTLSLGPFLRLTGIGQQTPFTQSQIVILLSYILRIRFIISQ